MEALDRMLVRWAENFSVKLRLDIYIDDFALVGYADHSTCGSEDVTQRVALDLLDAVDDLQRAILCQLSARISAAKAQVVGSSDTVVRAIRAHMGEYNGLQFTTVAANLGIDFGAGRSRGR